MGTFKARAVFSILSLILFTSLAYLFFLFQISNNISILLPGLVLAGLAIIGALFISFFLSGGITKPLSLLNKAIQEISKNNFDRHIRIRSCAEINELVSSFNHMSGQLKDFREQTKSRSRDLEQIIRERAKELNYIYKIGQDVSSTLDMEGVLDTIIKSTGEVLGLKICTILLLKETSGEDMEVLRARGINLKGIEKQTIRRGEGISGWVWDKKIPLLLKDVNQDSRFIGRKKERYYTGSLISVPLEFKGKIIGVINGNNKVTGELFNKNDLLLLKEIAIESAIAIENASLYKSLKDVYLHTISALASALEAKDHYTHSHSENVTKYAVAIAKELGLPASQVETIQQACQLHDLGKIGIHDYILRKTGKLSPEEWDEIKMHSLRGAQILQPIGFLKEVAELVRQHHERFDGKGYPYNLRGQDIQLGARIMTVADSFDAMISERPYRKALSLLQAKAELKTNSGTQFDPGIVKIFLKLLEATPVLLKTQKVVSK